MDQALWLKNSQTSDQIYFPRFPCSRQAQMSYPNTPTNLGRKKNITNLIVHLNKVNDKVIK